MARACARPAATAVAADPAVDRVVAAPATVAAAAAWSLAMFAEVAAVAAPTLAARPLNMPSTFCAARHLASAGVAQLYNTPRCLDCGHDSTRASMVTGHARTAAERCAHHQGGLVAVHQLRAKVRQVRAKCTLNLCAPGQESCQSAEPLKSPNQRQALCAYADQGESL